MVHPDPVRGLMLASIGMLLSVLSLLLTPDAPNRRDLVNIVKAAMMLGSFSLLVTLGAAAINPFVDVYNQRWGAIPPPGLIFGGFYGAVSMASLLALQIWDQERGPICDWVR